MVERNLAKVEVESSSLFSRSRIPGRSILPLSMRCITARIRQAQQILWRGSKAVMQRPAKPSRSVRLRSSPPAYLVSHSGIHKNNTYSYRRLQPAICVCNRQSLSGSVLKRILSRCRRRPFLAGRLSWPTVMTWAWPGPLIISETEPIDIAPPGTREAIDLTT